MIIKEVFYRTIYQQEIRRAMRNDGSDEPIFETDEERIYFLLILPARFVDVAVKPDTITIPSDNRRIPSDCSYQEKKILEYLFENGSIVSKTVEGLLTIKESRTRELLKKMVEKELIKKVGKARSTHYVLGDKI